MAELVSDAQPQQPALFLDRDGVINHDPGWIASPNDLIVYPFAGEAIAIANKAGFAVIVVSNQSAVARGLATLETIEAINQEMAEELAQKGAHIDAFYVCPHHPDFSGPCGCRKPQTGLVDRAVEVHAIDRDRSYLVGDTTTDLLTGRNAGLRTILVRTGKGGRDGLYDIHPDVVCDNLLEAVTWILNDRNQNFDTRVV